MRGRETKISSAPNEAVELLRAVRHDIDRVLAPEVSSPMATMIARMASDVLTYLIGQNEYLPAAQIALIAKRHQLLRRAISLARRLNVLTGELEAVALAALKNPPLAALHERRQRLDGALALLMGPIMKATIGATSKIQKLIEALMRDLVQSSEDYLTAAREGASAERAADIAEHDARRAAVTPERLETYWRERFGGAPRITALRELAGGFGKTTILFDVQGWEDSPASLVMRRDVLGGATETRVVDEFPVLEVAHRHGLPVPEPIFLERDASKLDRPFIVVRRVPGKPAGDFWAPSGACTPQTGLDLAQTLAKLHAIDPLEFGMKKAGSSGEQIRAFVQSWRDIAQRKQAQINPVLEMALCWIEEKFPPLPTRLSWVHSDPGFWNILIEGGRITALLDWELGHFGDPAEDISYVKASIEKFMSWQDFLDAYRRAGGSSYDEERGAFYAVWRDVRNAICSDSAAHAFWSRANPELRMAHCGIVSSSQVLQFGAQRIAAMGLLGRT